VCSSDLDLPAHTAISAIGRFIDCVAKRVLSIKIRILASNGFRFPPDVLCSWVCSVWHMFSFNDGLRVKEISFSILQFVKAVNVEF